MTLDEYVMVCDRMIRRGLEKWVSEIEPVIMYRQGEIFPFGIGIKGSVKPVIELKRGSDAQP